MIEHQSQTTLALDADDWQRIAKGANAQQLQRAFLGVWRDRESLGQELLSEARAIEKARLAVPYWLAGYVRLDGAAYASDMEASGVFVIEDVQQGICVFDGADMPSRAEILPITS